MVARAGGYYGENLTGVRGVTQRDPISPTIFNVVVYEVVFSLGVCGGGGRRRSGPAWTIG